MKAFCENELCENPGYKVVLVSCFKPCDGKRTLCAACEEVYTWGLQHGMLVCGGDPSRPPSIPSPKNGRRRKR
jgi:hypothetical protein